MLVVKVYTNSLKNRSISAVTVQEHELADAETIKFMNDAGYQIIESISTDGNGSREVGMLIAYTVRDCRNNQNIQSFIHHLAEFSRDQEVCSET